MDIAHPKRILLLAPTGVSTQPILNALTKPSSTKSGPQHGPSDPPTPDQPTHSISNSYYRASIPVWTDEVLEPGAWAEQWKAEEGAADVIRAVGAWIVAFHKPVRLEEKTALTNLLTSISSVLTHHRSSSSSASYSSFDPDTVLISIAVPNSIIQSTSPTSPPDPNSESELELDDLCREAGNWEYIDGTLPHQESLMRSTSTSTSTPALNEFGETTGIARLLEALQGGEWDAMDAEDGEDFDEFVDGIGDGDGGGGGLGDDAFMGDVAEGFGELLAAGRDAREERLLGSEIAKEGKETGEGEHRDEEDETWKIRGTGVGMDVKTVPRDVGGDWATDDDVENLQRMMLRLQAARDLGADLPEAERKRMAAKAVKEVMRDLD